MVFGGKCNPARWKRYGRGSGKRMAPSGMRCLLGGLDPSFA